MWHIVRGAICVCCGLLTGALLAHALANPSAASVMSVLAEISLLASVTQCHVEPWSVLRER